MDDAGFFIQSVEAPDRAKAVATGEMFTVTFWGHDFSAGIDNLRVFIGEEPCPRARALAANQKMAIVRVTAPPHRCAGRLRAKTGGSSVTGPLMVVS